MSRPALTPTRRRDQVLAFVNRYAAEHGRKPGTGSIVRTCQLHDRSSALRILRDLKRMGLIAE